MGAEEKVSRSSSSGEAGLVERGGAIWAMGVMNIEDTRRDVYRLDVWMCLISDTGSRCGGEGGCCGTIGTCRAAEGGCCGTIGMCRGNDGAR